ncbi:MAG: hypothetical protein WAN36_14065 [Calditrichia bacterium]
MILLASQNRQLCKEFESELRQEGFSVDPVYDYDEVFIHLYQNKSYRMILLDMEGDDGKVSRLCQKIKQNPETRFIPLICIVQKNSVVEHLVAFELGADEFIYVPYTTPELQLRLRSIQRLLNMQEQLNEKENQLKGLKQTQQILVTMSHYLNNSLTPLYSLVQLMDEDNPEDVRRLKEVARRTVEFINKVLASLNKLVKSGELKVIQEGVYRDLMLDIEKELKNLQK